MNHVLVDSPVPSLLPPAASTPQPHVLLVEDERKTRASIAEGLELEGWRVSTADSGSGALLLLEAQAFDLVVLDWMLPKCPFSCSLPAAP